MERPMITLYDYLPSQNAWKVRQLLHHLNRAYRTVEVSIFECEGRTPEFLARNPTGAVPVLELDDGRCLPESNAILLYLAEGTEFLPTDPWQRAQVARWMSFEGDYVQSGIATLRHWTLTGKLARRSEEVIAGKRAISMRTLNILERWLADKAFLVESAYSIADISVFAYVSLAGDAGLPLQDYPAVFDWAQRVRSQPRFLDISYPYSIDEHSVNELP
jgi:glutathione S-transferase